MSWLEDRIKEDEKIYGCQCIRCIDERGQGQHTPFGFTPAHRLRLNVCVKCGNKRCPHANDHRNVCTGSNSTGQPGSAYP